MATPFSARNTNSRKNKTHDFSRLWFSYRSIAITLSHQACSYERAINEEESVSSATEKRFGWGSPMSSSLSPSPSPSLSLSPSLSPSKSTSSYIQESFHSSDLSSPPPAPCSSSPHFVLPPLPEDPLPPSSKSLWQRPPAAVSVPLHSSSELHAYVSRVLRKMDRITATQLLEASVAFQTVSKSDYLD